MVTGMATRRAIGAGMVMGARIGTEKEMGTGIKTGTVLETEKEIESGEVLGIKTGIGMM